jgi:hypothetical protein
MNQMRRWPQSDPGISSAGMPAAALHRNRGRKQQAPATIAKIRAGGGPFKAPTADQSNHHSERYEVFMLVFV